MISLTTDLLLRLSYFLMSKQESRTWIDFQTDKVSSVYNCDS